MRRRNNRVEIMLDDVELARLDELCGNGSRATFLRYLIGAASPQPSADYAEALRLLSESARRGSVPGQVALLRALRDGRSPEEDDVEAAISRILDGEG